MNFRTLAVTAALCIPAVAFSADHKYQVTGPVVSADANSIVVKKGNDNWVIARGDDKTELKPGDKVTIEYTMTVKKVEVQSSGSSSSKKKAK